MPSADVSFSRDSLPLHMHVHIYFDNTWVATCGDVDTCLTNPIYASFYVPFLSLNNSYPNIRMLSSAGPGSVILQSGRVGYSPVECPVSTTLFLGFGFVIQYVWLKCQVKFQFQALLTGLLVLNMLLSH